MVKRCLIANIPIIASKGETTNLIISMGDNQILLLLTLSQVKNGTSTQTLKGVIIRNLFDHAILNILLDRTWTLLERFHHFRWY